MVYELICADDGALPLGIKVTYFEHLFSRIGVSTKLMVSTILIEVSYFEEMLGFIGVSSKLMIDTIDKYK
jgi:hypothetical protein